jgi:hypothetical protein
MNPFSCQYEDRLTDRNRLDADTLLNMCVGSIIGILAFKNLLSTEGVNEGSAACLIAIRQFPQRVKHGAK